MTVQERDLWRSFWRLFLSEAIGTALLLLIGLSLVIVMFGITGTISRPACLALPCLHDDKVFMTVEDLV